MIRVNNPTIFDTISISSNQKLLVSLKNKIDLSKGKVNLSSLSAGGAVSNAFSVGYNECNGFIKSNYSADEYYIFLFEYALGATVNQKNLFNNLIKNHRPNANVFFNLNDMYTFLDQV